MIAGRAGTGVLDFRSRRHSRLLLSRIQWYSSRHITLRKIDTKIIVLYILFTAVLKPILIPVCQNFATASHPRVCADVILKHGFEPRYALENFMDLFPLIRAYGAVV